jgi:hypothetical protein
MKMNKWLFLCGLGLSIIFISCHQVFSDGSSSTQDTSLEEDISKSLIATRVQELKANGLLDSLTTPSARSVIGDSTIDIDKIGYFISNTDEVLTEITQSDDGEIQLSLLDAMFNGRTVGEIADIMAKISEEMAQEYLDTITQITTIMEKEQARTVGTTDIRNIRLNLHEKISQNARAAFSSNFNQDTVNWYLGFCATTIAGLSAYKWCSWWQPWVGIAGLITAGAGSALMVGQLGVWYSGSDFRNWVNNLISAYNNPGHFKSATESANSMANSSIGNQLLVISIATAGVGGFCAAFTQKFGGLSLLLFKPHGIKSQHLSQI